MTEYHFLPPRAKFSIHMVSTPQRGPLFTPRLPPSSPNK